ncbi:MAG: hypothetical protein IT380_19755 [Myxococcales bacterium]|nr:hypothetical protein [Myxococcales bacterium]
MAPINRTRSVAVAAPSTPDVKPAVQKPSAGTAVSRAALMSGVSVAVQQRLNGPKAAVNVQSFNGFSPTPRLGPNLFPSGPTMGPPTMGPPTMGPPTMGPPTMGPPTMGPPTVEPSPSGPTIGGPEGEDGGTSKNGGSGGNSGSRGGGGSSGGGGMTPPFIL